VRIFVITLLFVSVAFAKVYYSKVEPYELRTISSNVSGIVLDINEENIGKKLSRHPYIEIDAELDKAELLFTKNKIKYLENTVALNEDILKNLATSLEKKRTNYEKVRGLKIKSRLEKDKEFYDLVSSENSYLATQKEVISLKTQIADLKLRKAQLIRSIEDKNLRAEGFILYSIDVKVGQVVTLATPLAKVADVSKGLLTIYLDQEDVADAKKKYVYIDGERTPYRISRLLRIADSKNISKYMAQIVIDAPKIFSKLAKIELKDSESEK